MVAQAMGFKVEECKVALDTVDGSVELACEVLVEAAEHETEPATLVSTRVSTLLY
jgi:hypothetical protein